MSRSRDNADRALVTRIEALLEGAGTDTRAAVAALALPGRIRAFSPHYAALRPQDQERLARLAGDQMRMSGQVSSVTGISAALAMNWCEARDASYRLERRGEMYIVERTSS